MKCFAYFLIFSQKHFLTLYLSLENSTTHSTITVHRLSEAKSYRSNGGRLFEPYQKMLRKGNNLRFNGIELKKKSYVPR